MRYFFWDTSVVSSPWVYPMLNLPYVDFHHFKKCCLLNFRVHKNHWFKAVFLPTHLGFIRFQPFLNAFLNAISAISECYKMVWVILEKRSSAHERLPESKRWLGRWTHRWCLFVFSWGESLCWLCYWGLQGSESLQAKHNSLKRHELNWKPRYLRKIISCSFSSHTAAAIKGDDDVRG